MNTQGKSQRHVIRTFKDNLIQNYFHWRIDTLNEPYQILFKKEPYRVLFILSHMRSGSSLLTHILTSNPEIIGYGETHLNYASEFDFKRLIYKVYWQRRDYKMEQRYVLDKVLHDNKFLNESFLNSQNLYNIFLLREPQRSLVSILDLKPHWNEEQAYDYYVKRLATLERYAKLINSKERTLLLDYDQLLENTDAVFKALQNLLGTKTEFSEQYQVFKTTGMRGIGDFSENLKSGRIIRKPRQLETKIAQDLVDRGIKSFKECSMTLAQYCNRVEI